MKIRDGAALWSDIRLYELDGKKLGEMSIHEVELLADLLSKYSLGDVAPFFDGKDLIIPFGAPLECRWWERKKMTDKDRYNLFLALGVPEDKLTRYMSPRDIAFARGEVDIYGREKKGQKDER